VTPVDEDDARPQFTCFREGCRIRAFSNVNILTLQLLAFVYVLGPLSTLP
jgi:hypothetical protein